MRSIPIWGASIPGNSHEEKSAVMEIEKRKKPRMIQTMAMLQAFCAKEFKDEKSALDSMTYYHTIEPGYEKHRFEDIPTLTPFPVKGGKQAVIVIPGGAYLYKQSDFDGEGKQNEGDRVAKALNEQGISAFVLWYRSNPYYFPIPLLDVQRAVRYLKVHADEFGIDPEQISLIGFSAGGFQSLGFTNVLCGKNMFPADYEPDTVDQASDAVQTASAGYPMVTFKYSPTGVFAAMPAEDARNAEKREAFIHAYDLMEQFTSADVPQFIHYGTKDMLIPPALIEEYVQCARDHGCDITTLALEGANHGYGADPKGKKTIQWIEVYANWLKTKSQ